MLWLVLFVAATLSLMPVEWVVARQQARYQTETHESKLPPWTMVTMVASAVTVALGVFCLCFAFLKDIPRKKHLTISPYGHTAASLRLLCQSEEDSTPKELVTTTLSLFVLPDFPSTPSIPNALLEPDASPTPNLRVSWQPTLSFKVQGDDEDRDPILQMPHSKENDEENKDE